MKGLLVLLGHFALMGIGWHFGLFTRHTPAAGDPRTLFAGVFFVYWAAVLFVASRPSNDWLFSFLNGRGNALVLSVLFGVIGLSLVAVGAIPKGAP